SAYVLARRHNDALAAFQRAIEWQPSRALYQNLSIEFAQEEKFADASTACQSAIAMEADSAGPCWVNLGIVLSNQGHFGQAVEALQRATAADPQNAVGWFLLGNALRGAQPDADEGSRLAEGIAEAYQKYLQLDPQGPYSGSASTALNDMHAPLKS